MKQSSLHLTNQSTYSNRIFNKNIVLSFRQRCQKEQFILAKNILAKSQANRKCMRVHIGFFTYKMKLSSER